MQTLIDPSLHIPISHIDPYKFMQKKTPCVCTQIYSAPFVSPESLKKKVRMLLDQLLHIRTAYVILGYIHSDFNILRHRCEFGGYRV